MATQKGIVSLVGTVGGVNFYFRKGKAVARKAGGGFSGKAIKTKASMMRVRENNSEFGHCSSVKKQFRIALFPFLKNYFDGTLHGRMMQLFQGIKNCDVVSERGTRKVGNGILTPSGLEMLRDFVFAPKCIVGQVVPMKASYDAVSCVYDVVDFAISLVKFPKGATHLELQFGVLGVDFDADVYNLFLAAPMVFEKGVEVGGFSMVPTVLPDAGLHRFAFVGVGFYQEVNGEEYVLKEEGNVGVAFVG